MKSKILKKIICSLFIGTIISITTLSNNVFAKEINKNNDIPSTKIVQNINNEISNNIKIEKNKIILKNSNELIKKIDDSSINELNKLAKKQGINKTYTKEEVLNLYKKSINNLNNKISNGELKLLEDGSLIEANDDSFYVQGGSTFDKKYWWGMSRWKSTSDANHWSYELNKVAAKNAGACVIAGAVFGGVGAVPNGLTSAYSWALANEISYKNSINNRGIVADINWTLVYSVYGQ